MLDVIPTEKRNYVYSLIPTIVALFCISIIPFVGVITKVYGLVGGIIGSLQIALDSSIPIFFSFFFKASKANKRKNINTKDNFGIPN